MLRGSTTLLVRHPALVRPGTAIDALTLALDIAPTVIDVAGGTPARTSRAGRWSRSAAASGRRGARPSWRSTTARRPSRGSSACRTRPCGRSATSTSTGPSTRARDELYDLAADPHELTNLAREPQHVGLRAELRRELGRLVAESFGL